MNKEPSIGTVIACVDSNGKDCTATYMGDGKWEITRDGKVYGQAEMSWTEWVAASWQTEMAKGRE